MPESTEKSTVVQQPSDGPTSVRQEWHAPELTIFGDARTLTESGGLMSPDGPGSFVS